MAASPPSINLQFTSHSSKLLHCKYVLRMPLSLYKINSLHFTALSFMLYAITDLLSFLAPYHSGTCCLSLSGNLYFFIFSRCYISFDLIKFLKWSTLKALRTLQYIAVSTNVTNNTIVESIIFINSKIALCS